MHGKGMEKKLYVDRRQGGAMHGTGVKEPHIAKQV